MRILLYSHDSCGLGHLRRTTTIAAEALRAEPGLGVVVATGSPVATRFRRPRGLDVVKLPSITKDDGGAYVPRDLPLPVETVVRMRARLLEGLVQEFEPDVLLVDHKPVGLMGELAGALTAAAARGTRCILGIRDVIDSAAALDREWNTPAVQHALRQQYHGALVYGDPAVFDTIGSAPALAPLARKVGYTGYVVRPSTTPPFRAFAPVRPRVVVTVGGGQDGGERVALVVDMLEARRPDWDTTIVLGPLFDGALARGLRRRAAALEGVRLLRDHDDIPALLRDADAVIAMAGYNTCAEILQSRTPAVFLPRSFPREEQLLRARRLAELGHAETLEHATIESLHAAVAAAMARRRIWKAPPLLDGARAAARWLLAAGHRELDSMPPLLPAPVEPVRLPGMAAAS